VLMLLGVQHSVRVVWSVSCCVFGVLIFRCSLTFVIFGFGNVLVPIVAQATDFLP
jgi:hypothetical protein